MSSICCNFGWESNGHAKKMSDNWPFNGVEKWKEEGNLWIDELLEGTELVTEHSLDAFEVKYCTSGAILVLKGSKCTYKDPEFSLNIVNCDYMTFGNSTFIQVKYSENKVSIIYY